jgi:hypothetical protein
METLITVLLTLSVTLNVIVFGVFGIAYRQWKKSQRATEVVKNNVEDLFKGWTGNTNN